MYLDIHRHSADKGLADKVLRNLFHNQTNNIERTKYCSVGLHPWHVKEQSLDADLKLVENAARESNVLAIGEAGLDKVVDVDIAIQQKAFEKQLEIAQLYLKPMIIHCVRAYDALQSYRKQSNQHIPWIFHWFNASPQTAFDLVDKGCYLSFGHMLFHENSKAVKSFKKIPLTNVFLETDDANVTIVDVYKQAADLLSMSIAELKLQMKNNFETCFNRSI